MEDEALGKNLNPIVFKKGGEDGKGKEADETKAKAKAKERRRAKALAAVVADYGEGEEGVAEPIDSGEVFEMLRNTNDPEHPLTLEQLNVVRREDVHVDSARGHVVVEFTPTIPHCSMATLIGLCLRVKLLRSLPRRFKVEVKIAAGKHASEDAINKQLADKDRVAAALDNANLLDVVNKCIAHTDPLPDEIRELLE